MALKARSIVVKKFTGGLWLNEGDPPNPSFATFLENLDIRPAGSLEKRPPLRLDITYNPGLLTLPRPLNGLPSMIIHPTITTKFFTMMSPGATFASSGTWHFYIFTKGNPVPTTDSGVPLGTVPTAFSMCWGSSAAGDRLYISFGNAGSAQFTAAGAGLGLTTAANDNLGAPTNGNFPSAKLCAVHLAYMFAGAASPMGASTCQPNLLAWSHPNRFQDWRSFDNLPVGDASENIIGLHSQKEALVIVKENSLWVLTGYSAETFQLRQVYDFKALSSTASSTLICSASNPNNGVFISMPAQGVYHWKNGRLDDISGGIKDAIEDSRIVISNMVVIGDKLYCSSSGQNSTSAYGDKSWVYDIGMQSWTQHNAAFHSLIETGDTSAVGYSMHMMGTNNGFVTAAYEQHQAAGSWVDNHLGGTNAIVATYRMPWLDGGNPALKKRFRRPRVVFNKRANASASDPTTYNVTVYRNWDGVHAAKSGTVTALKATDTTDYSTLYAYGHAATGSDYDEGLKLTSLGSGYSVQLKVDSSGTPNDQWGFDSITIPFIPKRLH